MLRAILNKSWRQHPKRHQLYGHLPPMTKTFQVRRTRHAVHCWRSSDELISDVLLSYLPTPLGQDMTQGQFLSGVWQVWIQSFPSPRLVASPRLKNLLCPTIYPTILYKIKCIDKKVMYSYGPPHMAVQKQDDQHEHTFSNYVKIRDVFQKTCLRRWTIAKSGERGSGISVLPARHDDDDDNYYRRNRFYI